MMTIASFFAGTPMGDFGLLFGPRLRENALELNFSFFASKGTPNAFNCRSHRGCAWISTEAQSSRQKHCAVHG